MQIGFLGGSALAELGPASDVAFFFECASRFGPDRRPELNWELITRRLYRHYVRPVDAEETRSLMPSLRSVLAGASSGDVDHRRVVRGSNSELDFGRDTLGDVFDRIFVHFLHCSDAAELFARTWGLEQPVRIVRSELPGFISDKKRPLSDYDHVTSRPFWLRR